MYMLLEGGGGGQEFERMCLEGCLKGETEMYE